MDGLSPQLFHFLAMLLGAFVLGLTPLRYPLQWLETFFHELSHGLAALVTFGKIGRIQINPNGSGWCTTRGGWRHLILLSGYFGASAWGALIYYAAWASGQSGGSGSFALLDMLLILLITITVLYVRHLFTLAIMLALGTLFYSVQHGLGWLGFKTPATLGAFANQLGILSIGPEQWASYALQFIGLYVMLNAIRSPLHLIDGRKVGDGAALQRITLIPEIFWVILWVIGGVGVLALVIHNTLFA